ncbi:Murein hydrolase activator NlpD [Aquicella siphonis]|uniref:Murein hydrolase activator NlpD n=2 Tax=Aquicella siphonis TaxID=254247 RepID=A0A5E4PGT6_9COXI|nr:Murein hydrolase activator NlpD [Aquicella siphonis]
MVCLLVSACSDVETYAPVTDLSHIEPVPKSGTHRVSKNETLYEIAWRYGLDYRYLARLNQISPPYTIHTQQIIYLNGKPVSAAIRQERRQAAATASVLPASALSSPQPRPSVSANESRIQREPNYSVSGWRWPARGDVINAFSRVNKGINIAGRLGEPVYAAAAGKVVYSGNGLRGYGNLIIIKHNSLYLSAYAHNNLVLVQDGDWVKQGQKIAEMGKTGADKVMLHFEIRRAGKPVDPMSLYHSGKS